MEMGTKILLHDNMWVKRNPNVIHFVYQVSLNSIVTKSNLGKRNIFFAIFVSWVLQMKNQFNIYSLSVQ